MADGFAVHRNVTNADAIYSQDHCVISSEFFGE